MISLTYNWYTKGHNCMLVRVDAEAAKEAENLRRNLLLAPASVAMLPLDDVMFLGKNVFTISHE